MNSGIYFYINKRTNKIEYIGQSLDIKNRPFTNVLYNKKKHKVKIITVKWNSCSNITRNIVQWYERRFIQKYKPKLNRFIPPLHTNFMHSIFIKWTGYNPKDYGFKISKEYNNNYDYYKALEESRC